MLAWNSSNSLFLMLICVSYFKWADGRKTLRSDENGKMKLKINLSGNEILTQILIFRFVGCYKILFLLLISILRVWSGCWVILEKWKFFESSWMSQMLRVLVSTLFFSSELHKDLNHEKHMRCTSFSSQKRIPENFWVEKISHWKRNSIHMSAR